MQEPEADRQLNGEPRNIGPKEMEAKGPTLNGEPQSRMTAGGRSHSRGERGNQRTVDGGTEGSIGFQRIASEGEARDGF